MSRPPGGVRIVVAGGTGFIGRHIAATLIAAGHEVSVLGRSPGKVRSIPELSGATPIKGDVTEPASLRGTLDGAHAVVGAVQFPNHPIEVPRKGLTYDRFDRGGTQNLLEEAKRAGVRRYVYMSGAGADLTSDKTWFRAKGFAERALQESGLDHAIVRPSWAYGPEDRALNRFAQIARLSPIVPRLGVRPQRVQPVHVDDIAEAVRRIFDRDAWGHIFEIGGPDVMTMQEIIETLLDVMGKRRAILPVPLPLAKLGTAPLVVLPSPPMTPHGIDFAAQDGLVDNSLMHRILEMETIPLRAGLARYIRT
ncbi:MAG TPA: complex I NDUFA9 subunit family protein [Actinomycetota bacterium]|nr:complex I NDUFA9 subunit family protein [Actinomycetota bacterium]